ncbi:RINT-1/Tip20 [Dillenia turbinata]|uniref:RINT-1/Tip20 n=1 Tax=Dillenia turbinata TaxID=194707 RepID=A0AAN8VW82_9MAGN
MANQYEAHLLGFLEDHLSSREDLSKALELANKLRSDCCDLKQNLIGLHNRVTNLTVSWISRSVKAKASIHHLHFNLHNLLQSFPEDGVDSEKTLVEHLPQLANEVRRIEAVRSYAEIALRLEALVGDLEDAATWVVNRQNRNMFSEICSDSAAQSELGLRQEKLVLCIGIMTNIEQILRTVARSKSQWCHLVRSADNRVDKTFLALKRQVLADQRVLLASIGWPPAFVMPEMGCAKSSSLPNPLTLMKGETRQIYSQSFLALCALQHLQAQKENGRLHPFKPEDYTMGLWAIDELVTPIASKMEYHFSKWIDQPELIFALVCKISRHLIVAVDDVLQPLIDEARLVSCSAKEAWVSAMIQVLSGFLAKNFFPSLAEKYQDKQRRPEVMSSWLQLIDLAITLDNQMQSLVDLGGHLLSGNKTGGFFNAMSVLSLFCDRSEWLKIWARIELKDAWKRLKPELKDERAWSFDNVHIRDFNEEGKTEKYLMIAREDHKAPLVADTVLKISRELIQRCQSLPSILVRAEFIRSTAVKFLWYFFRALLWRCRKTELFNSYLEDYALTRVCHCLNAASYCESKLQEWSDDVDFVELRIVEAHNMHVDAEGNDKVCFFAEELRSLEELQTNWLIEIIGDLLHEFESLSGEYIQNRDYFGLEQDDFCSIRDSSDMDLAVSTVLLEALDTLRNRLHLIRTNLNSKDFLDLWRSVANGLDHFIFCSILMSNIKFSDSGVSHLRADMQALFHAFKPYCARPEAFFPCIRDSLKLLDMDKEQAMLILCNVENRIKSLHFCGIMHLSSDQAEKVLWNRMFAV